MDDADFYTCINSYSSKPFHVNTGKGKVWYYLSHKLDTKLVSKIVGDVHKCELCIHNSKRIFGFFGPQNYAINLKGLHLYNKIQESRELLKKDSIDPGKVLLVTTKTSTKFIGSTPKTKFVHFSFKMEHDHITPIEISDSISEKLLEKLNGGSMDKRLEEIITNLQKESDENISDMEFFDKLFERERKLKDKDKKLLRLDFWEYRLNYIKRVQKYALRFENGKCFSKMNSYDKMHVRIFALFYGGVYSLTENIMFKACGQLVDCSTSAYNGSSLISFMNSRSDPECYLVQQASKMLRKHNILSRFTVSLAWNGLTDLDIHVKTPHGEMVSHSKPEAKKCKTKLDFDANTQVQDSIMDPVENITLDPDEFGKYDVYVNNYRSHSDIVPFSIIVNIDGEIEHHQCKWEGRHNQSNKVKKMIYVTTVEISQSMVRKIKAPQMSEKKVRKFSNMVDGFVAAFGTIRTKVVNVIDLPNGKYVNVRRSSVVNRGSYGRIYGRLQVERPPIRRTSISERTGGSYKTIEDILNSEFVTLSINGNNFPPVVVTRHNCQKVLKREFTINVYYEKGYGPFLPNPDKKIGFSRFDHTWNPSPSRMNVISINRLHGGIFLSLDKCKLPNAGSDWVLGAGMYETELERDYHVFRDMWASHHLNTKISVDVNSKPAIGIFLHDSKTYVLRVNGVDMDIII